jgi:hypothetical protein
VALMALALDKAHPGVVEPKVVKAKRDPYETEDDEAELTWRTA